MIDVKSELKNAGVTTSTLHALRKEFPGIDDSDAFRIFDYAKKRKLDPFIHLYCSKVDEKLQIGLRLAGYRAIALNSGIFAGKDAPVYGELFEFDLAGHKILAPEWCEITIYFNDSNGNKQTTTVREYFVENVVYSAMGIDAFWKKRPRAQLEFRTEVKAYRSTFAEADTYSDQEIIDYGKEDFYSKKEQVSTVDSASITKLVETQLWAYFNRIKQSPFEADYEAALKSLDAWIELNKDNLTAEHHSKIEQHKRTALLELDNKRRIKKQIKEREEERKKEPVLDDEFDNPFADHIELPPLPDDD